MINRKDALSKLERSALMAKVRSKNNASTELRVEAALLEARIKGWKKHPNNVPFKPDFYFARAKLALFVDGCFWHACPKCRRRIPQTRNDFWKTKIEGNRKRDNRTSRSLRRDGYHVMRIWEHEVPKNSWLKRLAVMLDCRNQKV